MKVKNPLTISKKTINIYEPKIELLVMDCMVYMKDCRDKQFDLAIVDPPYGIGIHKMNFTQNRKGGLAKRGDYSSISDWDKEIPKQAYWDELFRISKNQIIWGGNYFSLPPMKGWVFWDKRTDAKYNTDYADGELAWTSFNKPLRCFRWLWNGMLQQNMKNKQIRIHPTEKPKALYEWLLMNYAKKGDKIIDTHIGSGSIAMACWNMKYDLVGMDINPVYVKAAQKRLDDYRKQLKLF
ncbi:DNA methyltransferase [Sungkyunkwania multivorans]|uniref:Methyltransferase n=1 Tax=Sungkyunkwania multivorans TaxID=1173618 RepID=A0ABW3D2T3_9FLAO|nr:DNA methyltransferase [Aquimarina longa]